MPVIKSAIKKLRRDRKVERANDEFRNELDKLLKVAKKQKSAASVKNAVSIVDRAVKKNLMHKNRAARIKSSLSKLAKPVKSAVTVAKTATGKAATVKKSASKTVKKATPKKSK